MTAPGRRENEPDWVVRPLPRVPEPRVEPTSHPEASSTRLEFGEATHGRRRQWLRRVPAVLALLALAAFLVYSVHHNNVAAAPAASPTPDVASPAATTPVQSATAISNPVVSDLGHPLFGAAAGWELIGRGPAGVVVLDPAHGRLTRTPLPGLASSAQVSLVAGRGWVMVRPMDSVPGYLVPDGQAAQPLSGELAHGGPVLPGPDGSTVWVPTATAEGSLVALVDTLGRPTGPTLAVPRDNSGEYLPDAKGYLIFDGIGGYYDVVPDGMHRITSGALIAAGPTKWLTLECDDQHRCTTTVIDRRTGARHTLAVVTQPFRPVGVISPDGTQAAITSTDLAGLTTTHLVDLGTGADHPLPLPSNQSSDHGVMVWSPDNRWLFVTTPSGTLYVVDAKTGQPAELDIELPPLTQLFVRAAS
jgi:hypothetical protein